MRDRGALVKTRTELHERAIDDVARTRQVVEGTTKVAGEIADDVKFATSGSAHLRPYGKRMIVESTDWGATVGTNWGPDTPAKRILLGAAEKHGRIEFS
jgi:hypothetical protein